ncbi:uncharacterized protein LOC100902708 [Galendromus occidentalis]|uniref:Uncharacterized protein LOC100902708 n=1 Tax=Galendromus occidentalis TaxID=34638 RepID=A0AAJ6VZC5_9ACAR|nr:uncharacterized protein LOC100902708 [Galendromus occidentalis]
MSSQNNSHCCQRAHQVSPWTGAGGEMGSSLPLMDWFDNQMARIQDDLAVNRFFDVPHIGRIAFDPHRRSRLFDALFSDDEPANMELTFHENPNKNQVECQLSTGCGDFFRPEDIQVNVKDRRVEFTARREQKSDDGHNYSVREVRRVFHVPKNADIEKLHAEMRPNGKVMLTAPLLNPKPIEKKSDKPVPIKINRN